MKKFLAILVLGLLWCNASNAGSFNSLELEEKCLASGKTKSACKKEVYGWNLNEYLKDGYKITSEELVKGENWIVTIFILKKRNSIVTCKVDHFYKTTTCREP